MTNQIQPQIEMRVQNRQPIDRFPNFLLEEVGKTGTIIEVSDYLILIKMDDHIPGCEEWDNAIQLVDDEFGDFGDGIIISSMVELFNYYFEPLPENPLQHVE